MPIERTEVDVAVREEGRRRSERDDEANYVAPVGLVAVRTLAVRAGGEPRARDLVLVIDRPIAAAVGEPGNVDVVRLGGVRAQ